MLKTIKNNKKIPVPQEVQILKREHFNRYYGLVPYYFSMIAVKIPIQIILGIIYVTIVYLLTDQPLEKDRLLMFYTASILVSLVSQSLGMVIASRLSIVVILNSIKVRFNVLTNFIFDLI